MKLKLNFKVPTNVLNLSHEDSIVLLGSCFSDEMSSRFILAGHDVLSNSFGTLFHPAAIGNVLSSSLEDSMDVKTLETDGLFYSWDSSHKISARSSADINDQILQLRRALKQKLEKSRLLVVTFGTAWGYYLKETGQIVGNCHKVSSEMFDKRLADLDSMLIQWKSIIDDLRNFNPELQIVFTVSPVRHIKDGIIENNRSKSRLIELVHQLEALDSTIHYFPSYEILIDELRDYRFYAEDLVHPSSQAVEYIWSVFEPYTFDKPTIELNEKVRSIKRAEAHRSNAIGSKSDNARLDKVRFEKEKLTTEHPEIYWK